MTSENDIVEIVKKKGKKKQIQYNGEDYDIFFYSSFYQKKFYFVFENNEWDKDFSGNFKYTKKNLVIEGDEGAEEMTVELGPGEWEVRVLRPVEPEVECTISYKYTYVVS